MKYQIKKNSVQEALIIPVYGRKMCSMVFPNLFRDETLKDRSVKASYRLLAKIGDNMMKMQIVRLDFF